MSSKIYHPGIQNEYLFDTWEEAKKELTKLHGELAGAMLANCREVEITNLDEILDDAGFEYQGRQYSNTADQQMELDNLLEITQIHATDGVTPELQELLELDPDQFWKAYWTDAVGNPTLIVIQGRDNEVEIP